MRAQLQFEEDAHVYTMAGVRWPSVTQVLEPLTKFEFVDPDVLARAAELGQHVHKAVHLYDVGVLDEDSLDPNLAGYLAGWKCFLRDTGARILASELRIFHPRHQYAGTLDKILAFAGRHYLVDLKTATAVPRTVWPQTAAYLEALVEEAHADRASIAAQLSLSRRTERRCLVLAEDGTYRLRSPKTSLSFDFNCYTACLVTHRWRATA